MRQDCEEPYLTRPGQVAGRVQREASGEAGVVSVRGRARRCGSDGAEGRCGGGGGDEELHVKRVEGGCWLQGWCCVTIAAVSLILGAV